MPLHVQDGLGGSKQRGLHSLSTTMFNKRQFGMQAFVPSVEKKDCSATCMVEFQVAISEPSSTGGFNYAMLAFLPK